MELGLNVIDLFLHIDKYLDKIIEQYGPLVYLFMFMVVFFETGLVVTPILPGDSLLLTAGIFAARGKLELSYVILLFLVAAVGGDALNYWIGHLVGPKVFRKESSLFWKKEYLERTHRFYQKHGGKTVILARFMPIIRTFAPFVAGIGAMEYWRFAIYNVIGAVLWVACFVVGGFLFGNIPFVEKHFTAVIMAVIIVSIMPGVIAFARQKLASRKTRQQESSALQDSRK